MFSITEFIMKTLKGMIGKYPDFQIREYALNWYSKGKLTEEDLAEIETLIEVQYIVPEPPVEEIEDETEVEETETEVTGTETEETTEEFVSDHEIDGETIKMTEESEEATEEVTGESETTE